MRTPALLPALALLLVPCVIWAMSQRGTSVFTARYLLPASIGVVVGLAELWTLGVGALTWPVLLRVGSAVFLAGLCARGIRREVRNYYSRMEYPPVNFTGDLTKMLPRNMPIVVERADVADLIWAYQRPWARSTLYLLDWQTAMAPESPRGDVSGFHEMENWRSVGYFAESIVDSSTFLAHQQEFAVVDDAEEQWFERRIQADPHWQCERIGYFAPPIANPSVQKKWSAVIWRVHQR